MRVDANFSRGNTEKLRVAVVGGGPAGSSFAIFVLDYAQRAGLHLDVTIFEPRDFTRPGPWGCNMCAGLIPVHMLRHLVEIDVNIPPHVIRNHISQYTLHTAAGQIRLPQPDPEGDVISVYRGNGPRDGPAWAECISLDHFLLETAQARGARVVNERASTVTLSPAAVATRQGHYTCDLVVLAAGINRSAIHFEGIDIQPPPRSQMAQSELWVGEERVRQILGESVHIVLPTHDKRLKFGTLVPKGPCINISLLGEDLPPDSIETFLHLPQVAQILPAQARAIVCSCRPHIAVGAARPLYADRFVAVGDAGITRLYKNGIGSALRTARRAAFTAVNYGVSEAAFRAHYGPLCREIAWDNQVGRVLFHFAPLYQNHHWFARPQLQTIAHEQALPPAQRLHSRLLWGMFTGAYTYTQLLLMALHPRLHSRIIRSMLRTDRSTFDSAPGDAADERRF